LHDIHVNEESYIQPINNISLDILKGLSCSVVVAVNIDVKVDVFTCDKGTIDAVDFDWP